MNLRTVGIFCVTIGVSLLAGFWGSQSTLESITGWYAGIVRPSWTPPNWVFGPVWSVLYVLMGISAGLVWKTAKKGTWVPLAFFAAHLGVNVLWSIVFFGTHNPGGALIVIALLWAMIALLMLWFWRYNRLSTYLLIPYLVWVSYATTLNAGIYFLNT